MANDIQNFIKQIPLVTRSYIGAAIIVSIVTSFKFVSPYKLAHLWPLTLNKLQLWRPFTSFVYFGSIGLNFLFTLVFFFRYSKSLEEVTFKNDAKTFSFLYLFVFVSVLLISIIIPLPFSSEILRESITYLYSRYNPEARVAFLGLFNCPAKYLPLVTVLMSFLSGESLFNSMLGIIIGHIYFYFMSLARNSWLQKCEDKFVKLFEFRRTETVRTFSGNARHLE